MCGIAGFYGFRDDNLIKKFSSQLVHRGPDSEGYYIDDKATLLSRRLAIIDRKGGDQPIYNEDGYIAVIQNGEIYNYRELTDQLKSKGHVFKTKSDTEMVVHAFEQWGEGCFDKFNGMFAIGLYDKKKKKLVLARDHFGIKPLYYSYVDKKLIFSSEIKPILNSGIIPKKPNDRIIYRYLKFRVHDDNEETFFKGIYKLLPGQVMEISNDKCQISNYSSLEKELLEIKSIEEFDNSKVAEFKNKLVEAVRLRLISEVPVGSCLSGGLDSSTVVAIVNKLLKEKVKEAVSVGKIQNTFSAVFPGLSNDEERYVDDVVKMVGTGHCPVLVHKVYPKPEDFFKEIEDFVRTQEEPTISTGPYAQYKVMQEAHKYVTVVLDGQGSDEQMAGYLPYYFVYLKQLLKEKKYIRLINELVGSIDVIARYFFTKRAVSPDALLNQRFADKYANEKFHTTNDNLKKRLVEDIFKNSLPPLLRYEDKNSMRFSIEGRVPFLDFNLLRYLFSLDDEVIIKDGWNKYILRQSVKDLLPDEIVNRRNKIGFTTPEKEWFLRMKNRIYGIFLSESFAKRSYFNQPEVLKAFQKFIEGKTDDTMVFWRLMNLELWLRECIDDKKPVGTDHWSVRTNKKNDFSPNTGKKLEIKVKDKTYLRYPIRTDLFKKGDDYVKKISDNILSPEILSQINSSKTKSWFLVVSEKIVAIAQGRSYFIWDINPSFLAKFLSKYVRRTPYGIGLGSPWTMQLAIDEIGLPKIILATIASGLTKPLGIKGLFYKIAGQEASSIDGPTEYSLYPSNVSAKLGPKDPGKVAEKIKSQITNDKSISNFLGVAIIDANDLGQKVLGNSTHLDDNLIEKIFSDNPMGQADEQTPLVLVIQK